MSFKNYQVEVHEVRTRTIDFYTESAKNALDTAIAYYNNNNQIQISTDTPYVYKFNIKDSAMTYKKQIAISYDATAFSSDSKHSYTFTGVGKYTSEYVDINGYTDDYVEFKKMTKGNIEEQFIELMKKEFNITLGRKEVFVRFNTYEEIYKEDV